MFLFIAINVLNILDVFSTRLGLYYGLQEKNKPAAWAFRKIGFWKCGVLKVILVFGASSFMYSNIETSEVPLVICFSALLLAVASNLLWTLAKGQKPEKA